MQQENIKGTVKAYRECMALLKEAIENLQKECTHPETFEGLYSWREGCIDPAVICSHCGKLIKYVNDPLVAIAQYNPPKQRQVIDVVQVDLYRDGGSKRYADAKGNTYLYPVTTAFRKHPEGIYSDWPDKGGKKLDIILRVVKELNGVENGWWNKDHYVL